VVRIDATAVPYPYSGGRADTVPPLERSRRLNTVLLVIIAMLLLFGALGGTYLYTVVSGLSSTTGAAGAPGNNGAPGVDGSNGSDGSSGSNGFPGSDGTDGKNGADGNDGATGADGAPGLNGVDGAQGANGVTLYNSGQGIVDLGACDSRVDVRLRSRLDGDTFYLASITLSGISSDCWGSTVDVFALGGESPDWVTMTEATGIAITGETVVLGPNQLSDDDVLSSSVTRIALEIR
jgi:hypothetical protein